MCIHQKIGNTKNGKGCATLSIATVPDFRTFMQVIDLPVFLFISILCFNRGVQRGLRDTSWSKLLPKRLDSPCSRRFSISPGRMPEWLLHCPQQLWFPFHSHWSDLPPDHHVVTTILLWILTAYTPHHGVPLLLAIIVLFLSQDDPWVVPFHFVTQASEIPLGHVVG